MLHDSHLIHILHHPFFFIADSTTHSRQSRSLAAVRDGAKLGRLSTSSNPNPVLPITPHSSHRLRAIASVLFFAYVSRTE